MKKHVLIFSFIICSIALSYSISYGQEAKDNATYYYNIFDNNTTGSLTFAGGATLGLSSSATNSLTTGTGRCLRSTNVSTAGRAYASYIPIGTSLANDDWEWSFLYKNTGAAITTNPSTIANGSNTWRYWLMADGTTSGTAAGYYITEFNGVLSIRYKYANDAANPNNFNNVISYTLPSLNTTYAVKVQRLAGGLFKLYVDLYSASVPEAKTLRGSNSPGGASVYNYSMLECSSTTAGRFLFDELKMYTRQFQIVAYDAGLTPSPVGPGQPNTIVYSVALKMRGNYEFQQLTLNESPAVSTFLTSEKLYKSADATFTPAVPAPDTLKQTGAGGGYYSNINDVYQSSGNSADGSLTTVGYYYVAGTTKSPLANGTLTFSGITSITTKDFNGAQAYTAYNSGGASTTPITFTATTIAYTTPQTYTVGTAIAALTPTTTGSPTSYATTGLPPGLSLNTSNGQITGTPTSYSPATNYTITASNASGSGSTTINITVNGPPVISYATPKIYNVGTAIPTLDDVNSGGVVPTTRSYVVTTLAGSTAGTAGSTDATGTAARLNSPRGIAFDGSGNLFVADYTNNTIRKITAAGVVTTFAGTAGTSGTTNATGTSARFNGPYDIASDPSGNLYVCDITNNLIRKITTAGVVTTIATVNIPTSITYDTFSGNLFVTTGANNTVAKVTLAGAVTTFAGSATAGSTNGTGTAATFNITNGITSDVYGNLYVVDQGNNQIRKITAAGVVTTLAGSTAAGNTDATGTSALFDLPRGIASDALGNLYVTDNGNNTIRLITPAGVVTTIMGGTSGFVDGTGTAAQFNAPRNLGIDPGTGYIYIPDYGNNAIRKVVPIGYSISATLPAGLTFNNTNGQITGTPTATSAATNYIVTASNIYGSSSTTINITVNPAAPVITYTTPQTYIAGTAITALTPTNTGGTITSASSSPTLPAGLSISATGVITGTPTTVSSATVYTITATNAGGSDTYDLTITINPAAPIVAYSTPQTYSAGTAITALTPTNTGGVITSASVSPSLPAGLSISATGVITGTPTSPSTATVYNITATNVTGSSTFALTITVNLPATASNYAFTQTITLNTSALGINSTLTNFPYLVYIKEDALKSGVNCANNVQFPTGGTNGYDFGFTTSAGTTELNYEVESFDPTTGTLLAWVRVPSVTNTNSTLKFYFGSATPAHPASFAKSTWGSDYLDVFHMSETPSTGSTASDATTYGRNGTTAGMTAADLVTGKIGKAYSFNGSSKKITGPNTLVTGPFTISAWINLVASAADQKIMTNQDATGLPSGGFKLGIYNTNNAETEGGNIGNRSSTSPAPPTLATGNWVYIQGVYTGTTMSNYVNGYLNKTISTTANPFGNNPLYVGVGEGGNIYYFNGLIDEARFSTVAKSSDWITAEYNNQNTPANFTNSTAAITANLTYSAPLSASLVYTWTGAVGTDMATPGNWTAPVSGNPSMAPPTDGTASIIIPNTTSKPILSANSNYFGVTLASGATINLNGFTMGVGCNVYNSSGGQILSSNTASGLTFNGVNATQTYTGTATANTAQLGVLTLNNTGTGTLTLSGGPVDIYNKLVITNGNLTIAGSTTLTLKSTATLTASVPTYGVSGSVTGVVTAERYLSGFNRGYRLISAPLATATLLGTPAGTNSFDMTQVIKYAYISGPGTVTGSPVLGTTVNSNGFDYSPNNNPSIFMYKEADPNPASINIVGNEWKGFASINEYVPMGNGVLFFMRGDRTLAQFGNTTGNAFVSPYPFPNATTLKFVGNIITGDVPVYLPSFKTTASYYNIKGTAVGASAGVTLNAIPFATSTSYTSNAGNKNGYNLVGNPYQSTIDLEQVAFAGAGFGAAGTIGIYTLNKNNTYSLYVRAAATNTVGTANGISANNGSRYILSGQGFFVKALSTAGTITFKETAKTTYPTGTGLTGVPNVFSLSNSKPLLRVKLIQDTLYTNETLFTFGDGHANAFDEKEDIAYLGAPTQTVFLYSVADGNNPLVYNQMNTLEKITAPIKLYAEGNTTGIYKLEFTGTESIDSYYRIFLKDAFKKDSLEITANKVYTFNIDRANAATYGANRFTLVVQKSVLGAYQLVKFTGAKTADSGIKLNWETKNESDVITFNIERSTDGGKTYTDLGMIQSAGKGSYSFTDKTATIQTDLIYRLKQADVNDAILYSPLVSITAEKVTEIALNTIVVYPNPALDKINVDVSQKVTGAIELQIVNSNGKVMKKTTYPAAQHFEQNLSGLFPGAYVINLVESGTKRNVATTKFVKL